MSGHSIPTPLYHYTGPDGLLGIVSHGTLHATDLRFVNDLAEYSHALDLAMQLVATKNAVQDELLSEVIRYVLANRTEYFTGAVYIASFSEDGDDLNQWRAYSFGGTGFCLGFDSAALSDAAGRNWTLSQCVYDEEVKKLQIKHVLDRTLVQRRGKVECRSVHALRPETG